MAEWATDAMRQLRGGGATVEGRVVPGVLRISAADRAGSPVPGGWAQRAYGSALMEVVVIVGVLVVLAVWDVLDRRRGRGE